jgi:hypothetical protein
LHGFYNKFVNSKGFLAFISKNIKKIFFERRLTFNIRIKSLKDVKYSKYY